MAQNAGRGQERTTWGQCGEALARLQDSLFLDRDYWVLGNMEQRSQRSTRDARRHNGR